MCRFCNPKDEDALDEEACHGASSQHRAMVLNYPVNEVVPHRFALRQGLEVVHEVQINGLKQPIDQRLPEQRTILTNPNMNVGIEGIALNYRKKQETTGVIYYDLLYQDEVPYELQYDQRMDVSSNGKIKHNNPKLRKVSEISVQKILIKKTRWEKIKDLFSFAPTIYQRKIIQRDMLVSVTLLQNGMTLRTVGENTKPDVAQKNIETYISNCTTINVPSGFGLDGGMDILNDTSRLMQHIHMSRFVKTRLTALDF